MSICWRNNILRAVINPKLCKKSIYFAFKFKKKTFFVNMLHPEVWHCSNSANKKTPCAMKKKKEKLFSESTSRRRFLHTLINLERVINDQKRFIRFMETVKMVSLRMNKCTQINYIWDCAPGIKDQHILSLLLLFFWWTATVKHFTNLY